MDHPALFYLHQDLRRYLRHARHQTARHLEANPQGNPEYAWAKALERHMGDFAYNLPMFLYDQGLTEEFSALPHSAEVIVQVKQSEPPNPLRKGESYRVQSGDTLEGIARQYGITLAALYEVNSDLKAQNPRKLAVGAEVILPAGAPFGIKGRIDLLVPMHEHRMIELAYHLGLIERITGVDLPDLNYYRYGRDPNQWFWSKQSYQQDWDSPRSAPRDNWSAAPSRDSSHAEHPRQRGPWSPFFLNEQQQRIGELGQRPCRFRHKDLVSSYELSLGQPIITANRHIQEASPKRLEELISICRRRPYQLVLDAPNTLTGINNSMSNAASFIFNLGANAWNGIAMSLNYSYAVMSGAEKNISGAEAIYQLEQYIKADYGNLISNPKDYLQDTFTDLENYEEVAAALIAKRLALKGPGKGPKSKKVVKSKEEIHFVKQGDQVKAFTQAGEEIGDMLDNGLVKGKYSKRTFDPTKAGGPIQRLDWRKVTIDKSGIDEVKKHLGRLEPDPDGWNDAMIKRLEDVEAGKIEVTDFDKRFYTHELDEFNRYKELGYETQNFKDIPPEVWDNAHPGALEDYQIYELTEYNGKQVRSLYHPDVQQ